MIEPYACSLHAVRRAGIQVDDVVVLAGAGTLGLGMVGAIKLRNPRKLIALDLSEERLRLARRFGADITIQPNREDAIRRVLELTDGYGCDVYIEATGHPSAVPQGLEMICKGGTFVEFSVFSGPATADWSIIGDAKEIEIRGSQLSPYCFPTTIENIASGKAPTEGVVTLCPGGLGGGVPHRAIRRGHQGRDLPHIPHAQTIAIHKGAYFHDENWRADRRRRRSARH